MNDENKSNAAPDAFDRMLGEWHGVPGIISTKPSTIQVVTIMTGNAQLFTVQTYRRSEEGDTIFLQCTSKEGTTRIALPPAVANAISRQREALTSRARSAAAKAVAQARKDRGELPGFMKNRGRA